jgi:hypothetical protein
VAFGVAEEEGKGKKRVEFRGMAMWFRNVGGICCYVCIVAKTVVVVC